MKQEFGHNLLVQRVVAQTCWHQGHEGISGRSYLFTISHSTQHPSKHPSPSLFAPAVAPKLVPPSRFLGGEDVTSSGSLLVAASDT